MEKANYLLLIYSIITVLIFLLMYAIRKKKISEEILFRKAKVSNISTAVVVGASMWLFNSGVLALIESNGLFTNHFQVMNSILGPLSQGSIFIVILTVGIVAPFAEEFLFRGVVYRTLSKNIPMSATIIIQGVLFGIYHGNFIQGSYATLLGIIFGYMTYKTKSIWPAIVAHMINNTGAIVIPMIIGNNFNNTMGYVVFAIIGLIGVLGSIFILIKCNPSKIENHVDILLEE